MSSQDAENRSRFRPQAIYDESGNRHFIPQRLRKDSRSTFSDMNDPDLDDPAHRLL